MRGWRSKFIFMLIVYFAGFATAIYALAPTPQDQGGGETSLLNTDFQVSSFAKSFNSGMHKAIGAKIRSLRKEKELTLKQLARRTSLSISLLSQIERAQSSASISSLFKVATALDTKFTLLFGEF